MIIRPRNSIRSTSLPTASSKSVCTSREKKTSRMHPLRIKGQNADKKMTVGTHGNSDWFILDPCLFFVDNIKIPSIIHRIPEIFTSKYYASTVYFPCYHRVTFFVSSNENNFSTNKKSKHRTSPLKNA